MNKLVIAIFSVALLAVSCKKEQTTWSTNWGAPLVHGELTLNDMVPAEYTTTNSDNYLSIVYNEKAFGISLDTLVELPDTSIVEKTAFAFPLTINPGFVWIDSADQAWTVQDIELKKITAKQGDLTFKLSSEWGGNTTLTMDFPKVSKNGIPHYKSYDLTPGSVATPSVEVDVIDMEGYTLDLTGVSGLLYNTLSGYFIIESNETVSTFDVGTSDSIIYEISFENVKVDYAQGYFGQHTLSDTTAISLPFMNKVLGGTIDVDSIDMTISIMNGFNLLAQGKLTMLKGINSKTGSEIDLTFPELGNSVNINPATGGLYDWDYSEYPMTINNQNSNITAFIENLSDSLMLGYEIDINPYGNISGGWDEIFPGSTIDIVVNGEFPVDLGAQDLTLTDTFDISYTGSGSYTGQNAEISISYTNGFPMEAGAVLTLLDANGDVLGTLTPTANVLSGMYNAGTYATMPVSGEVLFNLNANDIANLEAAERIALLVSFTTDSGQKVKVQSDAKFDFNVRSNLQIDLHL